MRKGTLGKSLGVLYAAAMFAFIYLPTVVMVVYSFNQQEANT